MEKVFIIGNLGKAPEERIVGSGDKAAVFSIAANRKYLGKEETTWYSCIAFSSAATYAMKHLRKGAKVAILGDQRINQAPGRDGQPRLFINVRVSDVYSFSANQPAEALENEGAAPEEASQPVPPQVPQGFTQIPEDESDLPF